MPEKPCKLIDSVTQKSIFEDEALETIWEVLECKDKVMVADLVAELQHEDRIRDMVADGLIGIQDEVVSFTEGGAGRARDIVRRHRLAERLFADVLDIKDYEEDACRLEHAISPDVEEAICTLLGHPPHCPHGNPIPKGKCCSLYTRKVKPLVQRLRDLEVGAEARVVFINVPSMDRLATIGLVPGITLKLHQRKPSYVVDIEETTLALDDEIARGIYVKRL